eukprot:15434892-Alexandrium_andersonii.AAC.1
MFAIWTPRAPQFGLDRPRQRFLSGPRGGSGGGVDRHRHFLVAILPRLALIARAVVQQQAAAGFRLRRFWACLGAF